MAVHRGVGAASGRVSAPELLFGDPLPACDRWGDHVSLHLGGAIGSLDRHETLGYEARPTLPSAAAVVERVGPHALVSTQLRTSALPVATYGEVLADSIEAQFGRVMVDYGMATSQGVGLVSNDSYPESDDIASQQQDGVRGHVNHVGEGRGTLSHG